MHFKLQIGTDPGSRSQIQRPFFWGSTSNFFGTWNSWLFNFNGRRVAPSVINISSLYPAYPPRNSHRCSSNITCDKMVVRLQHVLFIIGRPQSKKLTSLRGNPSDGIRTTSHHTDDQVSAHCPRTW